MSKVLISYRRSDSAAMTGRIFDRLVTKYGDKSIFMDVDNIPFGTDFRTHIKDALLQSDLMLVVIGQHWLGRGEGTETRISDETDPVRVEVESALKGKITLIPLLVDGAQMPKAAELPESLRQLAYLNAAPVDSGRDFHAHIERLIRSIDQILEQKRKSAADAARAAAEAAAKPAEPRATAPSPSVPKAPAPVPPTPMPRPVAASPDSALPASMLDIVPGQSSGAAVATSGMESFHTLIRNPRDFWGGLALVLIAGFAIWASSDLPGMRGFAFGPGTAPRMFAYVLMGLGAVIMLVGLLTDGPPMEQYTFSGTFGGAVLVIALIPIYLAATRIGHVLPHVPQDIVVASVGSIVVVGLAFLLVRVAPRGPLFITAATIVFAIAVRPLGLVIASYVSLVVSAMATDKVHWVETFIWCAVLTLFCSLLFPWGLNLPLQLWPRF